jgi:hypothetical protein
LHRVATLTSNWEIGRSWKATESESSADRLDPVSLRSALRGQRPEYVFITTWLRQKTETENIGINRAMVRKLLEVLSMSASVKHVALVTELKHYLGPFEVYGKGLLPPTPFR